MWNVTDQVSIQIHRQKLSTDQVALNFVSIKKGLFFRIVGLLFLPVFTPIDVFTPFCLLRYSILFFPKVYLEWIRYTNSATKTKWCAVSKNPFENLPIKKWVIIDAPLFFPSQGFPEHINLAMQGHRSIYLPVDTPISAQLRDQNRMLTKVCLLIFVLLV